MRKMLGAALASVLLVPAWGLAASNPWGETEPAARATPTTAPSKEAAAKPAPAPVVPAVAPSSTIAAPRDGVSAVRPAAGAAAGVPADAGTPQTPPAAPAAGLDRKEQTDADLSRAIELRVLKRYDEALALLSAAQARLAGAPFADPTVADRRAEVGYQRGLVLEESGKLADAAEVYEEVVKDLERSPAAAHARLSLALVLQKLGKTDEAAAAWMSAARMSPKLASIALCGLAGLEESRGRPLDAARAWREVVRNFPESAEAPAARRALLAVCTKLGESKASTTILEEILARGNCLADANRAPEAEALYEAALKRRRLPVEARVTLLMALGGSLDAQDRFAAAEGAYRKVVRAVPGTMDAATAQISIVQGYLDRGRLSDAVRELERMVKTYPGTPAQVQAQFQVGSVQEALRNPQKAEEAYRKVLDLAPQSVWGAEAQRCLVRLLEEKQ